ncbi:MAG: UPF0058 family protein [Archaeoglobaceae archaeon]|nr:UPF0058 family protein [Archaeoglobaceae archaeon]MCX8151685.1 UPF0058 family protein [Archaeoglobaceae archaeon]MDW8013037.1 UPF0058 family protein [Archaeoglobaceae archaeon]
MQKDEVVLLHLTLFQVKKILEDAGFSSPYFREYDELGIEPNKINRSKLDHKKAIFLLCRGISEILNTKQPKDLIENEKFRNLILSATVR